MSDTADHDTGTADLAWPTPDPTLPPEQLTDRELIARAGYCDEIAHTGSPADQAVALRDLDAAWDEAERRAAGQPAISVPAQVAGYIGLIREDYDHALAAEAAAWRQQLDAALPPSELALDDPRDRRVATALDLAADRARSTATAREASGELTVRERADRADRAPSLAPAAGVDVAGPGTSSNPDTNIYTDPGTGQAEERTTLVEHVRNGQPTPPARRTPNQHEAYLESRPDETSPFNPAADDGDPDYREPASDAEAAARAAWLEENTPPAPGWALPPNTEVDDALERAVHSDGANNHDPYAWAEYQRLEALTGLAPLPERDALHDLADDEPDVDEPASVPDWHGEDRVVRGHLADEADLDVPAFNDRGGSDRADGPFTDTRGRWWPSTGAQAAGPCDPARDHDDGQLEAPDDPARLRQRIKDLHEAIAAREANAESEERREQLTRWHNDDHRAPDTDVQQGTRSDGDGEPGWTR